MRKLFILLLIATFVFGRVTGQSIDTTFRDYKAAYEADSSFSLLTDSTGMCYVRIDAIDAPVSIGDTTMARCMAIDHTVIYAGHCEPYFVINGNSVSFSITNEYSNALTAWRKYGNKFAFWYLTILYQNRYNIIITLR